MSPFSRSAPPTRIRPFHANPPSSVRSPSTTRAPRPLEAAPSAADPGIRMDGHPPPSPGPGHGSGGTVASGSGPQVASNSVQRIPVSAATDTLPGIHRSGGDPEIVNSESGAGGGPPQYATPATGEGCSGQAPPRGSRPEIVPSGGGPLTPPSRTSAPGRRGGPATHMSCPTDRSNAAPPETISPRDSTRNTVSPGRRSISGSNATVAVPPPRPTGGTEGFGPSATASAVASPPSAT